MLQRDALPSIIYAVDVESNGRTPPEIIELSVVAIQSGKIELPPITWTIKPTQSIRRFASNIHGIEDVDLQDSPALCSVQDEIITILRNYPILAHNARIDYNLLTASLPHWEPKSVHDTLRLARIIVPSAPSHSLSSLVAYFNISETLQRHSLLRPHRADFDAGAAAFLFLALLDEARKKGVTTERAMRMCEIDPQNHSPSQGRLL
jgi:DNA polymerase III epsilon subunit-like protein